MIYNPSNWYWYVGGDQTKAYSSATGDYVLATDPTFQAWLAAGNLPTKVDAEAGLGVVLANSLVRPVNASILDSYKDALASTVVLQTIFKILFNHENRIRAIETNLGLNGSPPQLTANQAKAAVKALM